MGLLTIRILQIVMCVCNAYIIYVCKALLPAGIGSSLECITACRRAPTYVCSAHRVQVCTIINVTHNLQHDHVYGICIHDMRCCNFFLKSDGYQFIVLWYVIVTM